MHTLSAHCLVRFKELLPLRSQWNELSAQAQGSSIFLTWEWMVSWLESVYPGADLFVVIVRDQHDRLVAVAPFYRTIFTLFSCFQLRTLRCLGDCHAGAEYPDVLIRKGMEREAIEQIAVFLTENQDLWDWAWFPNIAGWTGAGERLQRCFAADAVSFYHWREKDFSTVFLPSSWDEYMAGFSRQRRSTLRRQRRKAEQKYKLQVCMCSDRRHLDLFLEQLFDLHKKRWQLAGHEGAFVKAPSMTVFYRKMAVRCLEKGWLVLLSLVADNQVVATQYGYVYNGVFSQVQEGFDPDGPPGTGNILRMHVIRWCIEKKIREYDFLGGYTAHKVAWQAERRVGRELLLGKKCFKNLFFSHLPIWPSGRFIQQGQPAVLHARTTEK